MASVMPILLMVRMADVLSFRVIHSPVSGMKNFFNCKFGLNLRFVLWFEWLTLWPTIDVFPVKSQILDIVLFLLGGKRTTFFVKIKLPINNLPINDHLRIALIFL